MAVKNVSYKSKVRRRARIQGTSDVQHMKVKSGVELTRKRVFHIDNLDVNTTVEDVRALLLDAGVCVLSCYVVKSWIKNRRCALITSMTVCVPACDSCKILNSITHMYIGALV
jgi:hypothetical protein